MAEPDDDDPGASDRRLEWQCDGGLNGWIIFGLHYRALLPRLFIAVAFFGLFAGLNSLFVWLELPWLGWSYARSIALVAVTGYASLLSLRFVVGIAEFEGFRRAVAASGCQSPLWLLQPIFCFSTIKGGNLASA